MVIAGLVIEGLAGSMLMMVGHGAGGRSRDLEVSLSSLTQAGLRQESVSFSVWHLSFLEPSLRFQISPSSWEPNVVENTTFLGDPSGVSWDK